MGRTMLLIKAMFLALPQALLYAAVRMVMGKQVTGEFIWFHVQAYLVFVLVSFAFLREHEKMNEK